MHAYEANFNQTGFRRQFVTFQRTTVETLDVRLKLFGIFLPNFLRQLERSESFFHLEEFIVKLGNHVFPRGDGSRGEIGVPGVSMVS